MSEMNEKKLAQKLRENQNIDTEDHRETVRGTYNVAHKTHKYVKWNTTAAWVVGSGLMIWFCTASHGKYIGSFINAGACRCSCLDINEDIGTSSNKSRPAQ